MEFTVKSGNPEKQRTACVVVGVFEPRKFTQAAEEIDNASNGFLSNILRRGDMEGKLGQTRLLHNIPNILADRVLLVGCGKERDFDSRAYREIHTTAARALNESGSTECVSYLTDVNVKGRDYAWKVRYAIEVIEDSLYRFEQLKSQKEIPRRPLRKMILTVPTRRELNAAEDAVRIGMALTSGIKLTKDLANLPANICTPSYLEEQAKQLEKTYYYLNVEILEEADMQQLEMNALLSVAKGSRQPAKLIFLHYKPEQPVEEQPIVFVGKGVTFDSGGISIKPAQAMDEMKFDMAGGASVFGIIQAAAELHIPLHIIGVVPATENLPDGQASKPGDIVTSMSGQTIEILNTDAEGRLILCDALHYVERYNPDVVIDIATLTGACIVALGHQTSGLLGNHNPLINDLLNAGKTAEDKAWELPLWEEYEEQLKSNFADMANIGGKGAGVITASCFLSKFTKKYHWAHLDIAGTAWKTGTNKGATGRPVPLLLQYLLDRIEEKQG